MTTSLRDMNCEGRWEGDESTEYRVEYRANVLLIAFDSLHLRGLRYRRARSDSVFVLKL